MNSLKNCYKTSDTELMKKSKQIAKEIRTITIDTDTLPSWDEAKKLLENAKVFTF